MSHRTMTVYTIFMLAYFVGRTDFRKKVFSVWLVFQYLYQKSFWVYKRWPFLDCQDFHLGPSAQSSFVLKCHIHCILIRSLFFSGEKEKRDRSGEDGNGRWEELWERNCAWNIKVETYVFLGKSDGVLLGQTWESMFC